MGTIEILYGVIAILSFLLFWFGKMLYAQKSVVDSFKAQSDSVKNSQDMWLNQIKPETFQNAVDYAVRSKEQEYQEEIKKLKETGIGTEHEKVIIKQLKELKKYKISFDKLVLMAAGFYYTDEARFNATVEALELEAFEIDAINEVEIKYGFHNRQQKMRVLPKKANKP
jgi:hypothetical protein